MDDRDILIHITAIVSSWASANQASQEDLATAIREVGSALRRLGSVEPTEAEAMPQRPAVPIKQSVRPDHIVCLEDGRRLKILKRHLLRDHGMTPDEYRAKWHLPSTYPMVAPDYAASRSAMAKEIGLGRKPERTPDHIEPERVAKRGRQKKATM